MKGLGIWWALRRARAGHRAPIYSHSGVLMDSTFSLGGESRLKLGATTLSSWKTSFLDSLQLSLAQEVLHITVSRFHKFCSIWKCKNHTGDETGSAGDHDSCRFGADGTQIVTPCRCWIMKKTMLVIPYTRDIEGCAAAGCLLVAYGICQSIVTDRNDDNEVYVEEDRVAPQDWCGSLIAYPIAVRDDVLFASCGLSLFEWTITYNDQCFSSSSRSKRLCTLLMTVAHLQYCLEWCKSTQAETFFTYLISIILGKRFQK